MVGMVQEYQVRCETLDAPRHRIEHLDQVSTPCARYGLVAAAPAHATHPSLIHAHYPLTSDLLEQSPRPNSLNHAVVGTNWAARENRPQ
jgi:hypothetical protein